MNAEKTASISRDGWATQKAAAILGENEKLILAHAPSPRACADIFKLLRILARAFLCYPYASVKALFYFLNIKALDDKSMSYEPSNASLKETFALIKDTPLSAQGELTLPNREHWNDYLVLAHLFALRLKQQLQTEEDIVIKVRWGLTHGLYNAIVHGEAAHAISVRWQVFPDEFCLQLTNTKNAERMKPHNVAVNGIPVSGVGGSLVVMGILFDYFNLSEVRNASQEEEIRLTLIHRCNRRRNSLRYTLAARIAHARDGIQLERIWRKKARPIPPDLQTHA